MSRSQWDLARISDNREKTGAVADVRGDQRRTARDINQTFPVVSVREIVIRPAASDQPVNPEMVLPWKCRTEKASPAGW